MKDHDYITLYMPYEGKTQRHHNSALISQECIDWLNINVGNGTLDIRAWMLAHDTDEFDWCYGGLTHSPDSNYTMTTRYFYIKDDRKALMFKLVWGG